MVSRRYNYSYSLLGFRVQVIGAALVGSSMGKVQDLWRVPVGVFVPATSRPGADFTTLSCKFWNLLEALD